MADFMIAIVLMGVAFFLIYKFTEHIVKKELERSLPSQLQRLRDELDGKIDVKVSIDEDGKTKIKEVEVEDDL